jgi:hypothetical protein
MRYLKKTHCFWVYCEQYYLPNYKISRTHRFLNLTVPAVMNQVGDSKIPPSGHLFFSTNISNENKTRENSKKWPRARDRTSLISLRCVFFNTN